MNTTTENAAPARVLNDETFVQMRVAVELQRKGALGKPNADIALIRSEPGKGPEHDEIVVLLHITHEPDPAYPRSPTANPPWHIWIEQDYEPTEFGSRHWLSRKYALTFSDALVAATEYAAKGIEDEWVEMFRPEIEAVHKMPSGPHTYNISME